MRFSIFRRRHLIEIFFLIFLLWFEYFLIRQNENESFCSSTKAKQLSWNDLPSNLSTLEPIFDLNPRILCWVLTTSQRLDRALAVHETWASRCDHSVFIIGGSPPPIKVDRSIYPFEIFYLGKEIQEKYLELPEKVLGALSLISKKFLNKFDWFLKSDDDTYVIVENLRSFVRRRPSNISFYYGFVAQTSDRLYASGGAGYLLNHEALKKFSEEILFRAERKNSCRTDEAEDINIAYCLATIGIFVTNGRDDEQRERFHPMTFQHHFLGNFTKWIIKNSQFQQKKGELCCSKTTISFHYMSPDDIRMMDFLLYRIEKAKF